MSLSERLDEKEGEQGRNDLAQAFGTTSSVAVGTTVTKTYADIAKCVDAVKVIDVVGSHESSQAMKSEKNISGTPVS